MVSGISLVTKTLSSGILARLRAILKPFLALLDCFRSHLPHLGPKRQGSHPEAIVGPSGVY